MKWPLATWSEVLDIKNGKSQKNVVDPDGLYPIFGSGGQMGYANDYLCEPGTTIIGRKGSINSPIFVGEKFWNVDTAFGLCPRGSRLNDRFLYHFCIQYNFLKHNKVTTLPSLTKSDLLEIQIPLPSLAEQRRIAAILDKADGIRRKLQQSLRLSDDFLRSVFLDMFGDPVTNPKCFPTSPLGNLGTIITGNTPSRREPENYGDEMEWIKSDNINTPSHYLTPSQERLSTIGLSKARTAPKNSILVTCIAGSPDCIGNAALADRTVSFNQQINAVVPIKGVDWRFLYTQILVAKGAIQAASTKSMKGMVSKSAFSAVEVLHPPLRLQEQFGKIFSTIEASRNRSITVATDSNNLFSTLQQRAFRGEL